MFSNTVKNDDIYFKCTIFCTHKIMQTTDSIHFFKIIGMLKPENIKLIKKLHMGYSRNRLERSHFDFQN